MVQPESKMNLSRESIIDSLSARITKDISDAIEYVDVHEIVGLLEMVKISIVTQTLTLSAKSISDAVIGEATVN